MLVGEGFEHVVLGVGYEAGDPGDPTHHQDHRRAARTPSSSECAMMPSMCPEGGSENVPISARFTGSIPNLKP